MSSVWSPDSGQASNRLRANASWALKWNSASDVDGVLLLWVRPAGEANQLQTKRIEGQAHHRLSQSIAGTVTANASVENKSMDALSASEDL